MCGQPIKGCNMILDSCSICRNTSHVHSQVSLAVTSCFICVVQHVQISPGQQMHKQDRFVSGSYTQFCRARSAALHAGLQPLYQVLLTVLLMQALGSYVKEVLERCRFFQEWIDEGPPTIYWLSGFFFTQVCKQATQPDIRMTLHSWVYPAVCVACAGPLLQPACTLMCMVCEGQAPMLLRCRVPFMSETPSW